MKSTFGGVDGKRVVGGREMGKGEAIEVDDCEFIDASSSTAPQAQIS